MCEANRTRHEQRVPEQMGVSSYTRPGNPSLSTLWMNGHLFALSMTSGLHVSEIDQSSDGDHDFARSPSFLCELKTKLSGEDKGMQRQRRQKSKRKTDPMFLGPSPGYGANGGARTSNRGILQTSGWARYPLCHPRPDRNQQSKVAQTEDFAEGVLFNIGNVNPL
ncbi:hypothetical protein PoB_000447100 [Plakobranchus ocellatus]|uniref:Uncharacterized protein n=1 Tax=Plakobranchus ocellatus TaxID=259542 RepID=A0AAV3Y6B8_9GAST|nr:hypothetical protein PoB_000447100 [Plakobranchus ocellatus]